LAVLQLPAVLLAATPSKTKTLATTQLTPELRASLTSDYAVDVVVTPHEGDAWTRLAKRVTGDAERWRDIAAVNGAGENLTVEQRVHVPLPLLRPQLQRQIVESLFSNDRLTDAGWRHVVVGGSGVEGESLWNIAEWFTGRGENYAAIREANPKQGLSTHAGDVILIPRELLTAAFGGEAEGRNAPKTAEARKAENDPDERPTKDADVPDANVEVSPAGAPSLTYERSGPEPYAVYRLQKGEALYSSVAIRFTGRVYADDVGDVLAKIETFNGIDDVARIPVGYPVKIPMALLLPEYRPADDPARMALEATKRESAKLARHARASGLAGVRVILDAGHGGRDVGTLHDGVSEASVAYDVMCRLERILKKRSGASVVTTRDEHAVFTTPHYELDDDPIVGVNLRWYLSNSIFRKAVRTGVPREKVVFISIHADSLHPSLRGAMAYIPGASYVTGTFEKSGKVYLARAEVREAPAVKHSEKESLAAEGLSRDLAESIVDAFESNDLQVHPFNPVRDNVVRDGNEWVPAVIRYNLVPTRLLLEICNLGNRKDRELVKTKAYRQKIAESVYEGLVHFYAERSTEAPVVAASR